MVVANTQVDLAALKSRHSLADVVEGCPCPSTYVASFCCAVRDRNLFARTVVKG